MLDKLCSGMGCRPTDREFSGDESTLDVNVSLNRNKHTTRLCIDWLTKML